MSSATSLPAPRSSSPSSSPTSRIAARTTCAPRRHLPGRRCPRCPSGLGNARLSVVRRFAAHLHGIDPATEVPPANLLPGRNCRATPYLYSEEDIIALMTAAEALRTPHREATYRTLIGLLAVTGMRIGEAIGLDRDDFDAASGVLTIRNGKFGKSRELPLHPSTVIALSDYLRRTDRPRRPPNTPALFVSTAGTRLLYTNVQNTFHQLVGRAGIAPRSAACRPRLHDLRHAFAVRTLLMLIAMAMTRAPGLRCCRPISATSTLARRTGISRPLRSCCSWPVTVWSDRSEVAHDRPCHDLAGVLHRSSDPSAASQPAYTRRLSGHPAADAGLRLRAAEHGALQAGHQRPRCRAGRRLPRPPRAPSGQRRANPERSACRDPIVVPLCGASPPRACRDDRTGARNSAETLRAKARDVPDRAGTRRAARRTRPVDLDRAARPRLLGSPLKPGCGRPN